MFDRAYGTREELEIKLNKTAQSVTDTYPIWIKNLFLHYRTISYFYLRI